MTTQMHDVLPFGQILFGLKNGVQPIATTLELSDHEAQRWDARLRPFNRLTPTYQGNQYRTPREAFSYFEFPGGRAALLARFNAGDLGRNFSHAIVGAAPDLAEWAMYVPKWHGWLRAENQTFQEVQTPDWKELRSAWQREVLGTAEEDNPRLIHSLVAGMLAEPDRCFTVVGEQDTLRLLTLVREILRPIFATPYERFAWTFSTYEHTDTSPEAYPNHSGSPRLWCIPDFPSSGETERVRIRWDGDTPDSRYSRAADQLIETYFAAAPERYRNALLQRFQQEDDRTTRIAKLLDVSPVVTQPVAPAPPVQVPVPQPVQSGYGLGYSDPMPAYQPTQQIPQPPPTPEPAPVAAPNAVGSQGSSLPAREVADLHKTVHEVRHLVTRLNHRAEYTFYAVIALTVVTFLLAVFTVAFRPDTPVTPDPIVTTSIVTVPAAPTTTTNPPQNHEPSIQRNPAQPTTVPR
ncbi:hypothetical protein [Actinokineospora enzanensis]|uniref:hypothetical protein n=1 Tax=Actinokineospora enzanensis TaxID=155975 RepID=UPI0003A1A7A2|nr:hypothetical protein [Actinokineospora enzanensis]